MAKNNFQKGEIVIYKTPKNEVEVEVRFEKETVWLRQDEIARLYGKERSVITKHINNIFRDKDVILAVGYRTNSARAIHFRRWATNVLKRYLLKGYAINKKRLLQMRSRLKELQSAIDFLQKKSKYKLLTGQEKEIEEAKLRLASQKIRIF